ncbi:MoxR family ATPase [Candidatus Woesearchaeota archaeon]|nr:MoxR family ATPase [Candidatus Woesearchaeota archaeon]
MKKIGREVERCTKDIQAIMEELAKVVVGQHETVRSCIKALLCRGHVLLEGVPGIAKTLLIRSLANVSGCKFKRIQFTVDLLPTDILGIVAYEPKRGFYTIKGPIFSNFIIADEINRSPPKVQSALLESMQEKQVTIGKETFKLEEPFLVVATQNPIESGGVYPLPEAQVDRFLFKLNVGYPHIDEEQKILNRNISLRKFEDFKLRPIINEKRMVQLQDLAQKIFLNESIERYVVKIIDATRNPEKYRIKSGKYIEIGASPRGSISLFIGSKAEALLNGETFVTPQDVKNTAHQALRHRIILNYEGQAESIKTDDIITEILSRIPVH